MPRCRHGTASRVERSARRQTRIWMWGSGTNGESARKKRNLREIQEELGCQITELQPLPTFLHDYQTVVIKMIPFVCVLSPDSPAPQPHEHQALAWVTPMELRSYDLAAADWPALASYEQMI